MKMSRRTRVLAAVLATAVVGALAAGIVVARGGGTTAALAKGPPGVVATGKFRSVIWATIGTAAIVRDGSGGLTVRLSKTFRTQAAPELYVYVARYERGRRTAWVRVAPLRRAWGAQTYDLPAKAAIAPDISVTIFCEKCNKVWAVADLHAVRAREL